MLFKTKVELCEMTENDVAGRVKVKISALKISKDDIDNNDNGINWVRDYVKDNLKSFVGASYKVSFIDDDKSIPSGHGTMEYDNDGNVIFPDSDTVGSIQKAEIKDVEIDGESKELVVTEGYIYQQSYPNFVNWLRDEKNSNDIFCSVEINGKGKAKNIIYENGSKDENGNIKIGRKPKVFDFVSVAILSNFVPPADKFSRVLEINSKEGDKMNLSIELNELSADEIAMIISRLFNRYMDDEKYYWMYKLYPESKRFVMCRESRIEPKYFMSTYEIKDNHLNIGKIVEVEENWEPVGNELEVEINKSIFKNIINKREEINNMDEKVVLELNQKIETKIAEINNLTTTNKELGDKNIELNEAVVKANKALEDANGKIENLNTEINSCKAELEKINKEKLEAEKEQKKIEVNNYFKTEIPKNNFTEAEVNSLKSFVENIDLDGLKRAEADICTKKFKEMLGEIDTEVNSNNNINAFISIPNEKKKVLNQENISFFN